ncbi:hypothetical protein COV16_03430 [Candidatus Woesearchaeota archaeon CG10_big_fil_rev_8_21_14_0_10_34_8]|nr:MAG: hypothetical protein COV16_03430 [Candidatus Woesearchaeota archaeon CG10_big_fil_rev_8_21_14_0_10_34_8]
MAKKNKSNLYLLALVAIVAIVGIIVMIVQSNILSIDGNITGYASYAIKRGNEISIPVGGSLVGMSYSSADILYEQTETPDLSLILWLSGAASVETVDFKEGKYLLYVTERYSLRIWELENQIYIHDYELTEKIEGSQLKAGNYYIVWIEDGRLAYTELMNV